MPSCSVEDFSRDANVPARTPRRAPANIADANETNEAAERKLTSGVERAGWTARDETGRDVDVVTHGVRTTWKRDDDDVDTVRDGEREPVFVVREATRERMTSETTTTRRRRRGRKKDGLVYRLSGGSLSLRGEKRRLRLRRLTD